MQRFKNHHTAGMYVVDADISIDDKKIMSGLQNLLDDKTLTEIQTVYSQIIDPWTPYKSGQLHSTLSIGPDGIMYDVPYSAYKYFGTVYTKTVHPLATSHWDEVAMQSEMDTLEAKVKDILVARVKEVYG